MFGCARGFVMATVERVEGSMRADALTLLEGQYSSLGREVIIVGQRRVQIAMLSFPKVDVWSRDFPAVFQLCARQGRTDDKASESQSVSEKIMTELQRSMGAYSTAGRPSDLESANASTALAPFVAHVAGAQGLKPPLALHLTLNNRHVIFLLSKPRWQLLSRVIASGKGKSAAAWHVQKSSLGDAATVA